MEEHKNNRPSFEDLYLIMDWVDGVLNDEDKQKAEKLITTNKKINEWSVCCIYKKKELKAAGKDILLKDQFKKDMERARLETRKKLGIEDGQI